MRQSLSREPESDEDNAAEVDSRELSDPPDVEMSRRETATPLMRRDVSGLDVDEEIFSDMYLELEPPSTRGRSANTSTLSVGQFKRRSRAPSVVSRDGGPIRPSSRGQNTPSVSSTFNFGQFRRRAREPSILGRNRRAQKETQTTDQSASESELELDGEDSAPDAVSTPLNCRRSQRAASATRAPQPPSSGLRSRKRKSGEIEHEASDRPEKTARAERKQSEELGEVRGQEQAVQQEQGREATEAPADSEEDDDSSLSDVSSLPSPLSATAAHNERPVTPINATMEEIMAPPASSGSDDTEWPSIRKLANRRRRAVTPTTPLHARNDDDILSDISSPPSLTHSPNLPARRRGAGRARGRQPTREPTPEPLTSDLASLLPKRRSKRSRRDDDDLGSEDEDVEDLTLASDDEDELAYSRSTRRRGGSHSRGRGASARPPSRQAARAETHARSAAATRREQAGSEPNRRVTRTYGGSKPSNPDDSFAPLPDDSFTTSGLVIDDPKEELKRASHKFKEVDKWELEYEEVAENHSSSDPDAR